MNKYTTSIFLIVTGIGLIYWEIHDMKEKKKKSQYSINETGRVFSGILFGVVLILGGLFNIVIS